mmetsp:Transcript_12443/g.31686  ORF Transcript_12443/g.31686 Transcript_12443/m.31686 type:complete len:239 (-) Transcript_12443:540-1256(-)
MVGDALEECQLAAKERADGLGAGHFPLGFELGHGGACQERGTSGVQAAANAWLCGLGIFVHSIGVGGQVAIRGARCIRKEFGHERVTTCIEKICNIGLHRVAVLGHEAVRIVFNRAAAMGDREQQGCSGLGAHRPNHARLGMLLQNRSGKHAVFEPERARLIKQHQDGARVAIEALEDILVCSVAGDARVQPFVGEKRTLALNDVSVHKLLQALIRVVDTKLLKRVVLVDFEAEHVQN